MATEAESPILCDNCVEGDDLANAEAAQFRCRICRNRLFCDKHAKGHQRAKGGAHEPVDLAEGVCSTHRDSPLVAFCSQDETPVCEECLASAHEQHPTITLEAAAIRQRALLEIERAQLREKVGVLQQHRQAAQRMSATALELRDVAVRSIRAHSETLIEEITTHMEALMKQVEVTYKPLVALPEEAERRCGRAEEAQKQADAVLAVRYASALALKHTRSVVGESLLDANFAAAVGVAEVPRVRVCVSEHVRNSFCSLVTLVEERVGSQRFRSLFDEEPLDPFGKGFSVGLRSAGKVKSGRELHGDPVDCWKGAQGPEDSRPFWQLFGAAQPAVSGFVAATFKVTE